ncbi:MAG: 6-bladed beta-propeller, partial [Candidatus Krumholzibacteria bacterium]|nr:6-bladed beta-propeller [Candidatus Krumholzibacteria bacterium]
MKIHYSIPSAIWGFTPSLVLVLFLTGSSQTWDQEHTFRIFEEDGVTIAETGGGPRYSGEIFHYERLVTLHEDESRPESLMGRPFVYNLMGEDGSVFVTDSQFNRVLRFDATGEYLHDIGGQGRGPGEYLVPRPLSARDGIVTIYDRQMNRTSFFKYDGTFLESITNFRRRSLSIDAIHRGPGGEQIFVESRMSFEGRRAYVYFTSTATIYSAGQDTIATLVSGPVKGYYMIDGYICWRLFSGYPSARYHPDFGIIMTTGEEPVFKYYDL